MEQLTNDNATCADEPDLFLQRHSDSRIFPRIRGRAQWLGRTGSGAAPLPRTLGHPETGESAYRHEEE